MNDDSEDTDDDDILQVIDMPPTVETFQHVITLGETEENLSRCEMLLKCKRSSH